MQNDLKIEWLERTLPHGAGFDCSWKFVELKNGKIQAKGAFQCMDQNGYYCGYADFTLTIDCDNLDDFKLQFNGDFAQYLNRRYMLRDHIEDAVYYQLGLGADIALAEFITNETARGE